MRNTKFKNREVDDKNFGECMLGKEETLDPIETVRLYQLSESIDWVRLEDEIVSVLGRGSRPIVRLVCGTVFLKSFYELSSAEVIEKWPFSPTFRYFCGFDEILEGEALFPIPLQSLDILDSRLTGRGHDAMIKALLATSADDMQFDTRTLH